MVAAVAYASGSLESPSGSLWPWCLGPFGCGLVELLGEAYLERVAVRRPKRDTRFALTRVDRRVISNQPWFKVPVAGQNSAATSVH